MAPTKPTVAEVIEIADSAHQKLGALEQQLQEEIKEINFKAFQEDRPLTNEEMAERKRRLGDLAEVREGFRTLAFFTAQRLDDTAEVAQLEHQLKTINAGLEDDLAQLKQIEKFATIAAQVADALAQVAAKLAALAAKASI